MAIGTITTAVLAGVIFFLLMLGVKKMMRNFRTGSCCGGAAGRRCQGCTCCHEAAPTEDRGKI